MREKTSFATWRNLCIGLLILLIVLLIGAYRFRPTIQINVGDYYDRAFVTQFHDREVDAAGPGTTWEWPADQQTLELPGKATRDLIVTVFAADGQPDGILRGLALSVNGERIGVPRQGTRFLVGIIPADVASHSQLSLRLEPGLREGPTPPAGLSGRVLLEPARTYRWSRAESTLSLPGIGRGGWIASLDGIIAHPDGHPTQAQLLINEQVPISFPDDHTARRYHILIPPKAMGSGDLHLTITADPYHDPRPLGVLVSGLLVAPVHTGGVIPALSWMLPPWRILLASAAIVIVLVFCLARLGVPVWGVGGSGVVAIGGMVWGLATHRFPTTLMLPSIALLALWSLFLLIVLYPLTRRIVDSGEGNTTISAVNQVNFANLLLLIFFVGYWIKAIGMFYPYFVAIDVHWHMNKVRHILNGGLPLYYGINSPLNESTMPLAEWGTEKPVIPYSPYYHMIAASFILFPWSLEMSANMVSLLLDCLHVLLIALLALGGGLSRRAAVLAALLYAILPINFLLHSWGNVPTAFGLFWTFAATVFIVVGWNRMHHRGLFIWLILLFLATLLFYTVAGIFMAMFLVLFTLLLFPWIMMRRGGGELAHELHPHEQKQKTITISRVGLGAMWGAAMIALIVSLLAYYGQYIGPIIERTIPYFARSLTRSSEEIGKAQDIGWGIYLARHMRLWEYGLLIPLVMATGWVGVTGFTYWRRSKHKESLSPAAILLWAAIAAWLVITWLFVPLAYKVSMVDKHFFVSIPLMVIACAAVLDRFWRWWPVRVATLLFFAYLALDGLDLWIMRIMTVRQ